MNKFATVAAGAVELKRCPWGLIEAADGELEFVQPRPWPKLVSGWEAFWVGGWKHRRFEQDRVQFWYGQPLGHRRYLVLSYALSRLGTTLQTIRAALRALDEVAVLKRSDAILCEATNSRLSDRVMRFSGFERHLTERCKRHFIRRFYGEYPARAVTALGLESPESVKAVG